MPVGNFAKLEDTATRALPETMRGRKKDHTIPATRALTLQRDYRARKAHYIAELEARCKAAEAENIRLRSELETARQGAPQTVFSPETVSSLSAWFRYPSYARRRSKHRRTSGTR
jgi:hypothetical protein